MYGADEMEAAGVMGGFFRRLLGQATAATSSGDAASLRVELDRLRAENERIRTAMRHCIDCEYRIETIQRRAEVNQTASGGTPLASRAGHA